jgi:hypothetical protein
LENYLELEARLKKFLKGIEKYRILCRRVLNHLDSPKRDQSLVEQEIKLRNKLTREYGELQANIHGMAGYLMMTMAGRQFDIFLAAFDPRLNKENSLKFYGLDLAIQCANKAIGSCRHATSVIKKDKQTIVAKGASFEGFMEVRKLLLRATKNIFIQDRYLSADIFDFIKEIDKKIEIKIIVSNSYKGKSILKNIFNIYKSTSNNVEIKEAPARDFHSRKIIVDEDEVYIFDCTIQDIGKNESLISLLEGKEKAESLKEFKCLWAKSTPI